MSLPPWDISQCPAPSSMSPTSRALGLVQEKAPCGRSLACSWEPGTSALVSPAHGASGTMFCAARGPRAPGLGSQAWCVQFGGVSTGWSCVLRLSGHGAGGVKGADLTGLLGLRPCCHLCRAGCEIGSDSAVTAHCPWHTSDLSGPGRFQKR